jgi:hypothetical protein
MIKDRQGRGIKAVAGWSTDTEAGRGSLWLDAASIPSADLIEGNLRNDPVFFSHGFF